MRSHLNIDEVASRTGHTPGTIRKLRGNGYVARHGAHPLYSLGFKAGMGGGSRLLWLESDVDDFLAQRREAAMLGSAGSRSSGAA